MPKRLKSVHTMFSSDIRLRHRATECANKLPMLQARTKWELCKLGAIAA